MGRELRGDIELCSVTDSGRGRSSSWNYYTRSIKKEYSKKRRDYCTINKVNKSAIIGKPRIGSPEQEVLRDMAGLVGWEIAEGIQ